MPAPASARPLRFLLLTSSTGSGHDQRAYACRDWLVQTAGGQVEVRVDHLLENSSVLTRGGVALYNWIQRRAPWLHNLYWWIAEGFGVWQGLGLGWGNRYFEHLLEEFRPHLILSLHDSTNRGYFRVARHRLGPATRLVTYCGEFSGGFGFSRIWVAPEADRIYARTPACAEALQAVGFPTDRIRVFCNLHRPEVFAAARENPSQRQRRAEFNLAPDRFTLLLASGVFGALHHRRYLEALVPLAGQVQALVVCGRNRPLRQQLEAWAATAPFPVKVLGLTDQMARLLRTSDAVLARPGSNLTAEASFLGCPLLHVAPGGLMPQERLALRFLAAHGSARFLRRPSDLTRVVGEWLAQPDARTALATRLAGAIPRDHPSTLVEDLLALAREAAAVATPAISPPP